MRNYKYIEKLNEAKKKLTMHHQEENIAFLAMEDLFGITRASLFLNNEKIIPYEAAQHYDKVIEEVCTGLPYQYVIGFSWFYGEKFIVNPHVLIPRNETEEIVYRILNDIKDDGKNVADIGTGAGVIPIILKKHWKANKVFATDISRKALEVAVKNNKIHNTEVEFLDGDLFDPLINQNIKLDVLISNPPYISSDEIGLMTPSVIHHEPHLALFAFDHGLALYKKMINNLFKVMNDGGKVYFEIGFNQGEALCEYIKKMWPNTEPEVELDINNNPRILHFMWER